MVYSVMGPMQKIGFTLLLLRVLLFCILQHHAATTDDYNGAASTNAYIGSRCSVPANFTDRSKFKENMDLVFSTLTNDAPSVGFANTTKGQGSNTVYGLVQCRGDVDQDTCKACIRNSTVAVVVTYCPNGMDAIIWFEKCQLRYSNTNFFGHLNVVDYGSWYLSGDRAEDPKTFNDKLGSLLNNLASQASTEPSKFKFATGYIPYADRLTIYGLVQCTRDTSLADCKLCLGSTVSQIPPTCNNAHACEIVLGSCRLKYAMQIFYATITTPTPSPSPPPSNAASNATPGQSRQVKKKLGDHPLRLDSVNTSFMPPGHFPIFQESQKESTSQGIDDEEIDSETPLVLDLDIIRAATNNFCDANKLGQGGYGPVYKGQLPDGQQIAVKRLSRNSGQGSAEFKNEVKLVAKLQHRNLVRLLGCCLEGKEHILIYEYVPNKSLDKFLFDPVRRTQLDWQMRIKIVAGVARGLLYLHEDSRLKIIHRDLKASNILLDQDMTAKISDFGMAKLVGVDETHGRTSKIAGTYGYMAPEYAFQGEFSVKSDVFSFGVLMLETISGLKNSSFPQSRYGQSLLDYAWKLWRENRATELLDEALTRSGEGSEVVRCVHIGLLCVQKDATHRPTMSSVILMLSSSSLTLPTPSPPAFLLGKSRVYSETSFSGSSAARMESGTSRSGSVPQSINDMTISELESR